MYFFEMEIPSMLEAQNVSSLMEKYVRMSRVYRENPERNIKPHLSPVLLQVVAESTLSDGIFGFPCKFTC